MTPFRVAFLLLFLCFFYFPFSAHAQKIHWDVQPYIDIHSKRTMVPIRFMSEELGASVKWNPQSKEVTLRSLNQTIVLYIDEKRALVNGIEKQLDTKAIIRNGRTFIPLRFISETFGARVTWIDSEKKVVVKTEHKTIEMKITRWEETVAALFLGQVDPHSIELETSTGISVYQLSEDVMKQTNQWQEGAFLLFKSYTDDTARKIITQIEMQLPMKQQGKQNERFSKVSIIRYENGFWVTGLAKLFEASLSYVVEDGHQELAKGVVSTSKGAPQWGFFSFPLYAKKSEKNTTLTLLLFEVSPKDSSRQYVLPTSLP